MFCRLHLVLRFIATFATFALIVLIAFRLQTTWAKLHHTTPRRKTQISAISHILANISYLLHFCRYVCDMCISYLYFKPFLGIWANVYPHPLFWEITTTLSILDFYIYFFSDFFYFFLWRQPCVFLFLFSNFAPWIIKITLLWSYRK